MNQNLQDSYVTEKRLWEKIFNHIFGIPIFLSMISFESGKIKFYFKNSREIHSQTKDFSSNFKLISKHSKRLLTVILTRKIIF